MNKPVAWMFKYNKIVDNNKPEKGDEHNWIPLYTHPVKELTDEPVATMRIEYFRGSKAMTNIYLEHCDPDLPEGNYPLYTHPVKELTDEEMFECAEGAGCVFDYSYKGEVTFISKNAFKRFVQAILRKAEE